MRRPSTYGFNRKFCRVQHKDSPEFSIPPPTKSEPSIRGSYRKSRTVNTIWENSHGRSISHFKLKKVKPYQERCQTEGLVRVMATQRIWRCLCMFSHLIKWVPTNSFLLISWSPQGITYACGMSELDIIPTLCTGPLKNQYILASVTINPDAW